MKAAKIFNPCFAYSDKMEKEKKGMADRTDSKWINSLETFVKIFFWLELLAGVILGIEEAVFMGGIWRFFLWTGVGVSAAYLNRLCGMLLVNFLDNVQTIRIAVEDLRTRKPQAAVEAEPVQIAVEIAKLRRLKEQELITEDEFMKRAAQLQK